IPTLGAIGRAFIRVGDRAEISLVMFGEPESPPLLGASSLEALRLAVDPGMQRLVPMPWLSLFRMGRSRRPPSPSNPRHHPGEAGAVLVTLTSGTSRGRAEARRSSGAAYGPPARR